jgi:DNA invertase Pin-like site-specific DNA recombinase
MNATQAGKYVSYCRVSTQQQGRSGLGLEAQKRAVQQHLAGGRGRIVAEYVEIESGKKASRPKLADALKACRVHGATLIIAKLDRLARDAHFLLGLQKDGVDFVAADMPDANRLTVGILALIAEHEARAISERTKAALAAAKARGVKLGGKRPNHRDLTDEHRLKALGTRQVKASRRAADLAPVIDEIRASGVTSLRAIAAALDDRGIPAPRGGHWKAATVMRLLEHLPDKASSPSPSALALANPNRLTISP